MPTIEEKTETLNSLLRGELSAVETYAEALAKVGSEPGAFDLRRIEAEHREAVNVLRQHILHRGGKPATSSGAWGAFASAVAGAAKLFGNAAALKALKEGEEHGITSYESALKDETLDPECRTLVAATLLPQTRSHVPVLERLIEAQ
jgi:uncharacterized protein (TIGR02284 family)